MSADLSDEDVLAMWNECATRYSYIITDDAALTFARRLIADTREKDARIVDEWPRHLLDSKARQEIAAAIRAQGAKE